jgi:PBP1b-binding outer membrane lipoprotein LpoB
MPGAIKGYPYRMKQAVKATALILLVTLLSGCSSSPKPADKPLAKTECEIASEKSSELLNKASEELETKGRDYAKASSLIWAFYVIEKGSCFNSETVASAKTIIALYQK